MEEGAANVGCTGRLSAWWDSCRMGTCYPADRTGDQGCLRSRKCVCLTQHTLPTVRFCLGLGLLSGSGGPTNPSGILGLYLVTDGTAENVGAVARRCCCDPTVAAEIHNRHLDGQLAETGRQIDALKHIFSNASSFQANLEAYLDKYQDIEVKSQEFLASLKAVEQEADQVIGDVQDTAETIARSKEHLRKAAEALGQQLEESTDQMVEDSDSLGDRLRALFTRLTSEKTDVATLGASVESLSAIVAALVENLRGTALQQAQMTEAIKSLQGASKPLNPAEQVRLLHEQMQRLTIGEQAGQVALMQQQVEQHAQLVQDLKGSYKIVRYLQIYLGMVKEELKQYDPASDVEGAQKKQLLDTGAIVLAPFMKLISEAIGDEAELPDLGLLVGQAIQESNVSSGPGVPGHLRMTRADDEADGDG